MDSYNEDTFQALSREVLKATTDTSVAESQRLELFTAILKDVYRDGRVYGQKKAIEDFTHDLQLAIVKHDEDDFTQDLNGVITDYEDYDGND